MTHRAKATLLVRWAVVLAAAATVGCGGSAEEEDLPVLFSQYGGTGGPAQGNMATFDQEFLWSDGHSAKSICSGVIRVLNQEGAAWSGRAERGWGNPSSRRCYSSGEIAGELHTDGTIRFTLTQERWSWTPVPPTPEEEGEQPIVECTALGPGEYVGQLDEKRFYATGVTALRCDDGREATVTETMFGDYQAPQGSHDS